MSGQDTPQSTADEGPSQASSDEGPSQTTGGGGPSESTSDEEPSQASSDESLPESLTVAVENLGGIESETVTFEPGVTLLTGRNATNRTSLLRSLSAGLGGSAGALKADADAGSVTLSLDGTEHTRTFERDGDRVRVGGDPYTDDGTLVDQYCTVLADNPARAAVERGDGDALRASIMAPVDTADLEATIQRAQREIRSLEDDLESAERERDRIPELEADLDVRRSELESLEADLADCREAVAEYEADVDAAKEAQAVVSDLKDARTEHERVQNRLETQRSALASLEAEREAVAADLADAPDPDADTADLEAELERRQRRVRELETSVNDLLSIVSFNEELLDDDGLPTVGTGGDSGIDAGTRDGSSGGGGEVTAQLDPEAETVECWTCGTSVARGAIDDRLDELRTVVDEKRAERNELRTEIEALRSDLEDARSAAQEREALEAQLADIDAEIDDREARIAELADDRDDVAERIEALEAEAAESDDLRDSDLLEQYERLSELEYERGQLEERIDGLEADLESARAAAERVEELERDLDERRDELTAARTRIADLERAAVETFNDHMETVLDLLGYENVERVWIERQTDGGDGPVAESAFSLHVVRSTPDGAVYEDTVTHLSESEREVIGLVVALAGYLVHDVHESVPVVLLDSLEAIDADRIADLVAYFADYAPYLVVALLPEDAAALPDEYDRVAMGDATA